MDENISASSYEAPPGAPARRIFIRDCLIAEGLSHATHAKGEHSKGTLVLDRTQEVAIVRNLYANNTEPNPLFKRDTSGVVVNCVVANPGKRSIHAALPDAESDDEPRAKIAVVGRVMLFGAATRTTGAILEGEADAYFKDNEGFNWQGDSLPLMHTRFKALKEPPLWPEGLVAISTAAALCHVARFVGARPAERDALDKRIVSEALTGAGHIIDSQEEVGGYPTIQPVKQKLDVPSTNRRGWLEKLAADVELGPEHFTDELPNPQ